MIFKFNGQNGQNGQNEPNTPIDILGCFQSTFWAVFNRQKKLIEKSGQLSPLLNLSVFADFDQFVERVFVKNGDIRENFSVQINISFFQSADKGVISCPAVSCSDTDSCNP